MATYAAPKFNILDSAKNEVSQPDYFYRPPSSVPLSGGGPLQDSSSGVAVPYAFPKYAETRPGAIAPPSTGVGLATIGQSVLSSPANNVPATTDVTGNIASVAGATLSGAATGALAGSVVPGIGTAVGAAIGGGIGLVTSGLNAWLGNRQARAERDRQNAINADARRIQAQTREDNLKWQQTQHMDNLEAAAESRRQFNLSLAQKQYQQQAENMKTMLATNQALKEHFAKMGF